MATLEASQSPRILATLDTLALGQMIVALGHMMDMIILLPVCDEEEVQRSSRAVLQNRVKEFQHPCMQLDWIIMEIASIDIGTIHGDVIN